MKITLGPSKVTQIIRGRVMFGGPPVYAAANKVPEGLVITKECSRWHKHTKTNKLTLRLID